MENIKAITVRFDLTKERDSAVWEHLHKVGKSRFKTCSNAVIEEIKNYISLTDTVEMLNDTISKSIKTSIREEFTRIISPDGIDRSKPNEKTADIETETKNVPDLSALLDSDFLAG